MNILATLALASATVWLMAACGDQLGGGKPNWVKVTNSPTKTFYYDQASASREGNVAKVVALEDRDQYDSGGKGSRSFRYEFNCGTGEYRATAVRIYRGNMATDPEGPEKENPSTWTRPSGYDSDYRAPICAATTLAATTATTQLSSSNSINPLGSASGGPTEDAVRGHMERQLANNSKGMVKLNGFKKTDGLAMVVGGVSVYEMDWLANLEVTQDCWFKAETLEAAALEPGADILYASSRYQKYQRGQRVDLTGKTSFQRRESGWRAL
jgi:hypothetical protein